MSFLLGIIFALVGIPILNSIADLIYGCAETIKSYLNIKISTNNRIIQGEVIEPKTMIGFKADEEETIDEVI